MVFVLTPGETHESTALFDLLNATDEIAVANGESIAWPVALAGDKGYRADSIDEALLEIEDRASRAVEFDRETYRERNIIERLIGWLKESRRIMTRFEKTARNFGGMIKMAFIRFYLKLLCS